MGKAYLNPALTHVSGKFGGLIFRQQHGQTIIARAPEESERRPSSVAQVERQNKFKLAAAYAAGVMRDPLQLRLYRELAKARKRPTNAIIIQDYHTPPVVDLLELSGYRGLVGDLIKVLATDDIEVVGVTLTIRDAQKNLLEQGAATKIHGVWVYAATTALPPGAPALIVATAKDRPGNEGRAELLYSPSSYDLGEGGVARA